MKPTDEQIRAEAERMYKAGKPFTHCANWEDGAKWALSHNSTIEQKSTLCQCANEDMTGWIELKCCNICGKPIREHGIEGFVGCPKDSTIEKVKELREHYEQSIIYLNGYKPLDQLILVKIDSYGKVIEELNAIIEQ